ncbi:hypothetical protein WDU94_013137 [Cyamophila willieti]
MKKESENERYLTVKSAKSIRPSPSDVTDDGRIPSINISQATPTSTLRKPSPPPAPLKPQQDCGPRIFKKKAPSPTGFMQLTARDLLAKQIADSREDSNQGPSVYELGENRNNDLLPSSSSQDYLLDTRSGEDTSAPLRPIKKIDDVKTIKRQPSDGWM